MKFEFLIRLESTRGDRVSDWSKYAATKFLEKTATDTLLVEKTLSDRKLVDRRWRELWDSLCSSVKEEITSFNAEPGLAGTLSCTNDDPMTIKISCESRPGITITFDPQQQHATLAGAGVQEIDKILKITIADGDHLRFVTADNHTLAVEQITQGLLKGVLGV
jgi:hypothetical protein